jgi:hypothetical protein
MEVLLYHFFQDSTVDPSQWRVILNALESPQLRAPSFNKRHHAGLCNEVIELHFFELTGKLAHHLPVKNPLRIDYKGSKKRLDHGWL